MLDELILVQRLRTGDMDAFKCIYLHYFRRLCAFASLYVPFSECEEVVQDVMMWLWENRVAIASDTNLKSFLFTTVKNKCINRNTHLQIKSRVLIAIQRNQTLVFEDPNQYEVQELMSLLRKTLKNIPEDYWVAFTLNRFENLTYKEIAAQTGVSFKTVAYRISQTLKILRKELKEYLVP